MDKGTVNAFFYIEPTSVRFFPTAARSVWKNSYTHTHAHTHIYPAFRAFTAIKRDARAL